MRFEVILGFGALALGSAYLPTDDVQAKGFEWSDPKRGSFVLEGVCSVSPSSISCWDAAGKADTSLADRVRAQMTSRPTRIPIKVGKKNRVIVGKWTPSSPKLNAYAAFGLTEGPEHHDGDYSFISVPKDQAAASVRFTLQDIDEESTIEITPKTGQKVTMGGSTLEIGRIVKTKGGSLPGSTSADKDRPVWRIYLQGDNRLSGHSVEAINPEGGIVTAVTPKGIPIVRGTAKVSDKPTVAMLQVARDIQQKESWIDTNVDPSKLKSITFRQRRITNVIFPSVALDPKE